MKYFKYILPVLAIGALTTACDDDDDNYGVLDGLGVVYRSQTIAEGAHVPANTTKGITLSYNNLIEIAPGAAITINGTPATCHTEGMNLVFDLNLDPWTDYVIDIPAGALVRADDNTVGCEARKVTFDTKTGINLATVDRALINPNATQEAKDVYAKLLSTYGKYTLSGLMNDEAWGSRYHEFVSGEIGKKTIIRGFDYGHLASSPSNWIDYGDISAVQTAWNSGCIPQFQWHWNVPVHGAYTYTAWKGDEAFTLTADNSLSLRDAEAKEAWKRAEEGGVITIKYTVPAAEEGAEAAAASFAIANVDGESVISSIVADDANGTATVTLDADMVKALKEQALSLVGENAAVESVEMTLQPSDILAFYLTKEEDGVTYYNDFDAAKASEPGTWENDIINADLQKVAGYLKLLQDAGIPVLWRPLHEAAGDYTNGAWFWWGAKGTEATKKLYLYMYDQLTNVYGLNNLIWVWTVDTTSAGQLISPEEAAVGYPGDKYVDIVGTDIYPDSPFTDEHAKFDLVNASAGYKKMVALTECGNMVDPASAWNNNGLWLYFMQWYDMDSEGNFGFNNYIGEQWTEIFNSPYVLDLDTQMSMNK